MIKICGLTTPETLEAALVAGADMVGFMRFAPSPRHVTPARMRELSRQAAGRARRVLVTVDPTDDELDEAVAALSPDMVQLHGRETAARAAEIGARFGLPVMKAIGVAEAADLAAIAGYEEAVAMVLLDAKPPRGADRPGGHGAAFDWSLLAGLDPSRAVMLSGGLTPENVGEAIAATGLGAVDVSSGVESRPGEKDPERIAAFVRAARAGFAAAADAETRRVA